MCQFALLVFPAWHHRVGVCGLPRSYTRTPFHSWTRNFLFCGCPAASTILLLAGVAFPPHLSQAHKADAVQIFSRLLHCYYFSAAVHGRCAVAECQLPFSMNSHTSYEQWELVVWSGCQQKQDLHRFRSRMCVLFVAGWINSCECADIQMIWGWPWPPGLINIGKPNNFLSLIWNYLGLRTLPIRAFSQVVKMEFLSMVPLPGASSRLPSSHHSQAAKGK